MPSYRVEQYELHVVRHLIKRATSAADAIEQVFQQTSLPADSDREYLEPADAYGLVLPLAIVEELRTRGMTLFEQRVPSIRSVEQL